MSSWLPFLPQRSLSYLGFSPIALGPVYANSWFSSIKEAIAQGFEQEPIHCIVVVLSERLAKGQASIFDFIKKNMGSKPWRNVWCGTVLVIVLQACGNKGNYCHQQLQLISPEPTLPLVEWEVLRNNDFSLEAAVEMFNFDYCLQKSTFYRSQLPNGLQVKLVYAVPFGSCLEILEANTDLNVLVTKKHAILIKNQVIANGDAAFQTAIVEYFRSEEVEWPDKKVTFSFDEELGNEFVIHCFESVFSAYFKFLEEKGPVDSKLCELEKADLNQMAKDYPLAIVIVQKEKLPVPVGRY